MNKKSIQYAALVFMIMGLIGIISETGPVWARFTLLLLGILFFVITFFKKSKRLRALYMKRVLLFIACIFTLYFCT